MYPSATHALAAELDRLEELAEYRREIHRESLAALYDAGFLLNEVRGPNARETVRIWNEVVREKAATQQQEHATDGR